MDIDNQDIERLDPELRLGLVYRASDRLDCRSYVPLAVYVKLIQNYDERVGYSSPGHKRIERELGISEQAVTKGIQVLINQGLIAFVGNGDSYAGRKRYAPIIATARTELSITPAEEHTNPYNRKLGKRQKACLQELHRLQRELKQNPENGKSGKVEYLEWRKACIQIVGERKNFWRVKKRLEEMSCISIHDGFVSYQWPVRIC